MIVRPVLSDADMDAVYRLTHDGYVEQGYIAPQPEGRLRHHVDVDAAPENMVLVAVDGSAIVGTVSITLDGPAGLHADHDFNVDCDAVRAEGWPVGAVWRIVTEPGHRASRATVLLLIQAATTVMFRADVETALCTFAPHHERAYAHLLGFRTIARSDGVREVATPAVLMRQRVADAAARIGLLEDPALATLVAERRRLIAAVRRVAA